MKAAKRQPTVRDDTIIVVRAGESFELRLWNRLMGDSPIGERIAGKEGLPPLSTKAATWGTALDLQKRWQQWLEIQPINKRGRKR